MGLRDYLNKALEMAITAAILSWLIWFKIGDMHPYNSRLDLEERNILHSYKDGEPVYYQPAEGLNKYGKPYSTGKGDRKNFVILYVDATEAEVRELFKKPRKNSNAYRKGRQTYYFLDLEKIFTASAMRDYRDHNKEVAPLYGCKIAGLEDLSDYRKDKARLDKPFVHGSITDGSYTIGSDPEDDYTNPYTWEIDIAGDIGDGNVIGTVQESCDVGGNSISIQSHATSAIGSIKLTSNAPNAGMASYEISNTTATREDVHLGTAGNHTIEYLTFDKFRFWYVAGNKERTTRIKNVVVDGSSSSNKDDEWIRYDGSPTNTGSLYCYDFILITPHKTGGNNGQPIEFNMASVNDNDFNGYVFFENGSIFVDNDFGAATCQAIRFEDAPAGQTYTGFTNLVAHGLDTYHPGMVQIRTGSTVHLNNPAYKGVNFTQSGGAVTQDNKVTSADGDFLSLAPANVDFGRIDTASNLYAVGESDVLAENTADIIGIPWAPAAPSIGAFSGYLPPPLDMGTDPEVYYQNHAAASGAVVTVTSEDAEFPKENLTREALWANWKAADTSSQILKADCAQAVTVSRLLLSGEFVDLSEVVVKVEYSYNDSSWNTSASWTQADEGPVLVRIPEITARYWRVTLSTLTTEPVIGHWGLYDPLVAPRELGDGSDLHRARDLSTNHITENGKEQTHKGPQMRRGRLILGNVIHEGDVADKVDELRDRGVTGKIYICLEPDTAPEEVFCALLDNPIKDPVEGKTRGPRLDYREVT